MRIESLQNPRVKEVRRLYTRKYRYQRRRTVVEGVLLVAEALAGSWTVESLFFTEEFAAGAEGEALLEKLPSGTESFLVTPQVLAHMAETEHPQGVVAVVTFRESSWARLLAAGEPRLLVADRLQDPGNLGTLLRAAEAFGATGLLTTLGSTDPFAPKALRAAMGSTFRLPILTGRKVEEIFDRLAGEVPLYHTVPSGGEPVDELDLGGRYAFVVGNEAAGVSPEWEWLGSRSVTIPMTGSTESLNAGMAGVVLLYEAARQRRRRDHR